MKQALQLNIGQHLTLTPQLQQAIRLLQLSTIELQYEIQEILNSNPMLEVEEGVEETFDTPNSINEKNTVEQSKQDEDGNEIEIESEWEEEYAFSNSSSNNDYEDSNFENYTSMPTSLHDHLLWQLRLTPFSEQDYAVATTIIDAINEDGFLTASLQDIQDSCTHNGFTPELDEIEAVLHRIQYFDPPGIAARELQECLIIQLRQLPLETPHLELATKIVLNHFDLLSLRDAPLLSRRLRIAEEEIVDAIRLIQSLNPRPGNQIERNEPEYIAPDLIITKRNGRWHIELNIESIPKLKINQNYSTLIQRANSSAENNFLRSNLQEARWFLKSLQSRNDTLLKVAICILEHQAAFLEHGPEAMKPLTLHTIAERVGMHESTISRVTTQKFIATPRGIFELKYFFSNQVSSSDGTERSATAIRARIKKLIDTEDRRKPLSDSKIAKLLSKEGIQVARRTVAKYREALAIPPSNERKTLM